MSMNTDTGEKRDLPSSSDAPASSSDPQHQPSSSDAPQASGAMNPSPKAPVAEVEEKKKYNFEPGKEQEAPMRKSFTYRYVLC